MGDTDLTEGWYTTEKEMLAKDLLANALPAMCFMTFIELTQHREVFTAQNGHPIWVGNQNKFFRNWLVSNFMEPTLRCQIRKHDLTTGTDWMTEWTNPRTLKSTSPSVNYISV